MNGFAKFAVLPPVLLLSVVFAACSDSVTATDAGATDAATDSLTPPTDAAVPDVSAPVDAGIDAPIDAPIDAAVVLKTCTDAELAAAPLFANGADVSFFIDGGPNVYTNSCVRIQKGKDVGFYGNFVVHPLANNGEPGSPIPSVTTGTDSGRIVFPNAGKFSFHCTSHPSTMFGTVLVEP